MGETGTGKELAARALHLNSGRAERPFLVVDCASVSSQFLEDKIFGHAQGAYTGAHKAVAGVFEEAYGGTVFLDEVGELPLELQPKLLRVIERREATRIGSHRAVKLDVRLIAATHRNLLAMVKEGSFREDLYYRLAEITVAMPPLRNRREDIELIVKAVLEEEGRVGQSLSADALAYLRSCDWPGNVRELRNLIRRASALTKTSVIDQKLLEQLNTPGVITQALEDDIQRTNTHEIIGANLPLNEANEVYRKAYAQYIRDRYGNDLNAASMHTGLHPKSISRLFRKYGVY
jgi:two-component system response regulator AtoC